MNADEFSSSDSAAYPHDAEAMLELSDRHILEPDDEAVAASLTERSSGRPWFGGVPTAGAASVKVMAEFLRDYPTGSDSPLQVASSSIEPPSAVLAFHTVFPKVRFHPPLSAGDPDPRAPLYPGKPVVWRYEGTTPSPAVAPPPLGTAERVGEMATEHWSHITAAYRRAAPLAEVALPDLCAVLVHPPVLPAGWRPDHWIRAVQVMACLGIAHHRGDRSWRESAGAGILVGLSLGPEDWVVEAACFALVASAWVDPLARPDAGSAVAVRWLNAEKAAATRGVSILDSLTRLVLACPWLDKRVTDRARDLLVRIEGTRS